MRAQVRRDRKHSGLFLKLTNTRIFDIDVCSEAHNLELDINEKSLFEVVRSQNAVTVHL